MRHNNTQGAIHLVVGPMFAGKTTEILRLVKRYEAARQKTAIVVYGNDD